MLLGKVKRDSDFVESVVQEALAHLKGYGVYAKESAKALALG